MGRVHGLTINSEIPLGFLTAPDAGGTVAGDAVLLVRRGPARDDLVGPPDGELVATCPLPGGEPYFDLTSEPGSYRVRFQRRCECVVRADLREVVVYPAPGTTDDELAMLVAGTTLGVLLNLADHLVLHASAFVLDAGTEDPQAVAVLGESGAGKSTFVALACAAGATFVADDALRVDFDPAGPVARAGHSELRLRRPVGDAVCALLGVPTSADATTQATVPVAAPPGVRVTNDDHLAVQLGHAALDRVPLGACVLVRQRRDLVRPAVRKLALPDAALALARAPRVVAWRLQDRLAHHFTGAVQIARSVEVLELDMPVGAVPRLDVVREALALIGPHCVLPRNARKVTSS